MMHDGGDGGGDGGDGCCRSILFGEFSGVRERERENRERYYESY
jgi:hypothetical protein